MKEWVRDVTQSPDESANWLNCDVIERDCFGIMRRTWVTGELSDHRIPRGLIFGFENVFESESVLARWFQVPGRELWTAACRATCCSSRASSSGRPTWACCPGRLGPSPPSNTWPPLRETSRSRAAKRGWRFPTWNQSVLLTSNHCKCDVIPVLLTSNHRKRS